MRDESNPCLRPSDRRGMWELMFAPFLLYAGIGLSNKSSRVEFVFVSNLNGLRNSRLEPNPFIKRVENLDLYPFIF